MAAATAYWLTLDGGFRLIHVPGRAHLRQVSRYVRETLRSWPARERRLPDRYFIQSGYKPREQPAYDDHTGSNRVIWQPDVYRSAAEWGRLQAATTIVDMGCGDGRKLAELYPEFDVIGLDIGANIKTCQKRYDFGKWIEFDIGSGEPCPVSEDELRSAIVVASDVVEHLVYPERLLGKLRRALDVCHAVILSTPERNLARGTSHLGPPPNPAHVREWSIDEFAAFLASEGFHNGTLSLTRSNNAVPWRNTILAVLLP